jgi:membrane protein DedA with SNARE-associated domain
VPSFRSLILLHGYLFLFCYVFAVQAGMPIPSDPLVLIMGAFIGNGRYSFPLAFGAIVSAAMLGDLLWFELGRFRGRSVLRLLCKLSLEPDTCVRKTELGFMKRGAWTLLFVKFVPGISLVSMPLAGAIGMSRIRFLLADFAGTSLWCAAYLGAGILFRREIDAVIILLGLFGRSAGIVLGFLLGAYVGFRYFQRIRFRRQLRIDRISPLEAYDLIQSGHPITVVDLRNPPEIEQVGFKIAGARILRPAQLRSKSHEIPEGHEVILYCT